MMFGLKQVVKSFVFLFELSHYSIFSCNRNVKVVTFYSGLSSGCFPETPILSFGALRPQSSILNLQSSILCPWSLIPGPCKLIPDPYLPNGHFGNVHVLHSRQNAPFPIVERFRRVISTPASILGRRRSRLVIL